MSKFLDLLGTSLSKLQIAIGGVLLKNTAGSLLVRNPADTADAAITASQLNNSGDQLILNSDAVNAAADWSVTLARPTSGMTASWMFTVPPSPGTAGYVLQTNGAGVTTWVANSGATNQMTTDTTTLSFGTSSPLSLFTLPANAVVEAVRVIVDTPFTGGTPSLSVGVTGTTSKYLSATQVDLTTAGIYEVYPGKTANGSAESLIATYAANSASAGTARVEVDYVIPS